MGEAPDGCNTLVRVNEMADYNVENCKWGYREFGKKKVEEKVICIAVHVPLSIHKNLIEECYNKRTIIKKMMSCQDLIRLILKERYAKN